jgi:hypothetical protein
MSPKLRLGKRGKDDGTGSTGPKIRTTHRSSKGTKLYAVRDSKGRFVDIQTYKRAHAADMRRKSKAELSIKKRAVRKRKK